MFDTQPILLKGILTDVSTGKIQLPDFQRGWVWNDERITELLVSISRGFPIGAITTLSAGGDIKFKPRLIQGVPYKFSQENPNTFVLDGQQRLTSLYQSLLHVGPVNTQDSTKNKTKRWYYIDMLKALDPNADKERVFVSVPENRKVTSDFGRQTLMDLSSPELEYKNHMMPTEQLFDGIIWIVAYNQYWSNSETSHPSGDLATFVADFANQVTSVFGAYLLPVINLGKGTPKEAVCKVFEKVNTGGVTLTVFELVTASFAAESDDFRLRDNWSKRSGRLRRKYGVLQGIEGEHFLQAVALMATNQSRKDSMANGVPENQSPGISCKKETILDLGLKDYERWADKVERGLEEAAQFLMRQFIFSRNDVPYSSQIIPLAVLFAELGEELQPAKAKRLLERWFWSGIFGEFYGGNTETQFALDLRQVTEYVRGGPEPTLVTQSSFIPERLLTLRTRNSAAYKGLYALQMKSGAADWRTADPLSVSTWLSMNTNIHHIFPKAWCRKKRPKPIPAKICDSIINKTPIDARTNRIIGGRGPSSYIPRLEKDIDPRKLDEVLQSHWLHPELLRADKFAQCFVERGLSMLDLIGKAMGKPVSGGRKVFSETLEQGGIKTDFIEEEEEDDDVGEAVRLSENASDFLG